MLVDLVSIFREAPLARMAFNITSVEGFQVLTEIGETYKVPLILQISERYLKDLGPSFIRDTVIPRLDHSPNPFVLHLDHAGSLEAIVAGIRLGFTSVMYDGSTLEMPLLFCGPVRWCASHGLRESQWRPKLGTSGVRKMAMKTWKRSSPVSRKPGCLWQRHP